MGLHETARSMAKKQEDRVMEEILWPGSFHGQAFTSPRASNAILTLYCSYPSATLPEKISPTRRKMHRIPGKMRWDRRERSVFPPYLPSSRSTNRLAA